MQQFFLFCTMLIIASEAFSKNLYGSRISKNIKRRTSFAQKLIPPNPDRYIFRRLNFPMFPVPHVYQNSDYEEPFLPAVGRYGFPPKRRNSLSVKKRFTNRKRSRIKYLKQRRRRLRPPRTIPPPADFDSFWPAGPAGFGPEPPRNFTNLFWDAFDSPRNPKQYIVWLYPVFVIPGRKTIPPLGKRRFLNLKRQYWTSLTNKNKRSASNATTDVPAEENGPEVEGSENQDYQIQDPVLAPRPLGLNPSGGSFEKFEDEDKNKDLDLNLDPEVNSRYDTFGKSLAEYSNAATETYSPDVAVTLPKMTFKYPYDPLVYEPSLRSSQLPRTPIKETLLKLEEEENTKKPAEVSHRGISRLRDMLLEVESMLKSEGDNNPQLEKPELDEMYESRKEGTSDLVSNKSNHSARSLKQKIDYVAIPILMQISADLEKMTNKSSELNWKTNADRNGNDNASGNTNDSPSGNGNSNSNGNGNNNANGNGNNNSNGNGNNNANGNGNNNSNGNGNNNSNGNGNNNSNGNGNSNSNDNGNSIFSGTSYGKKNKGSKKIGKSSKPNLAALRCSADGTWTSQAFGLEMTFTTLPNLMLKVKVVSKNNARIDKKWSIQGLTLSKQGGPLLLAAIYPQGRKVASFIGQCKMFQDQDMIFGSWTIFTCVRRFTDLWRAVETKLDILKKNK